MTFIASEFNQSLLNWVSSPNALTSKYSQKQYWSAYIAKFTPLTL